MKNLLALKIQMNKLNHPGTPMVQAALDCSNSPDFICKVATAIADAAEEDYQAEVKQLETLSKLLGRR